jgi:hypothetical protein
MTSTWQAKDKFSSFPWSAAAKGCGAPSHTHNTQDLLQKQKLEVG